MARHKSLTSSPRKRDGLLGLGAACVFLAFVGKFNEQVQTYKDRKECAKRKSAKIPDGLVGMLMQVLAKTCSLREGLTVAKLSLMLLLRTFGSVWVARHWGNIVNVLVKRNFRRLTMLVIQFAGATISLAFLNALLKYYISSLRHQIREKITGWCHEKYMRPKDLIFYKANRVGNDKIENCDHQITSDVDRFSDSFAEVLSQSLKPIVDFLVYSFELSRVQGLLTPLTLYAWFAFASCISTVTLPPFGRFAAEEQQLEGKFRGAHSAQIENCEQIAFLGGERPQKAVLDREFRNLMAHCKRSIQLSFNSEVVRQYLNKYFVTVIGLFLIARPVRLGINNMDWYTPEQIAQYFTSTWKNMELMSTSIQDLFELTNRIGRLSGFASRVSKLMSGLEVRPPVLTEQIEAAKSGPYPPCYKAGTELKFEHVAVYRPDGTLLVKDLNFTVTKGMRVLVTGPNGCGKSSLFRVIRRLWPLVEGTITMPPEDQVYFLSQVNFVPQGTLRDLVIYPQSVEEMKDSGRTDKDVHKCLKWAHVSTEVQDGPIHTNQDGRPNLDEERDWRDLAPGQKQRIAFARLFYHRAGFVILDECTNGISPDVEHDLYDRCSKLGLAIFSISHKIELKLFHDYELHYNGDPEGTWEWNRCSERVGKNITRSSSTVKASKLGGKSPQNKSDADDGNWVDAKITYERELL